MCCTPNRAVINGPPANDDCGYPLACTEAFPVYRDVGSFVVLATGIRSALQIRKKDSWILSHASYDDDQNETAELERLHENFHWSPQVLTMTYNAKKSVDFIPTLVVYGMI